MDPQGLEVVEYDDPSREDSRVHLSEYVEVCRRRIWLIVILSILGSGLVALWSLHQPVLFRATASVLIEPRTPKVMQTEVEHGTALVNDPNQFQTHLKLMTSYPVLEETVKQLNLVEEAKRNQILSQGQTPQPSVFKRWLAKVGAWTSQAVSHIRVKFLGMQDEAEQFHPEASLEEHSNDLLRTIVGQLADSVNVELAPGTKLVQISVAWRDADFAARAANTLATVYIERSREASAQSAEEAAQWFSSHLDDLRAKVERSEKALYDYRAKFGVDINAQQSTVSKNLEQLNSELVLAGSQRTDLQTRFQQIEKLREDIRQQRLNKADRQSSLDALSDVQNSPVIQMLRNRDIELNLQRAELSRKYGPLHPKMIFVETQLAELRSRIDDEIDKIYRSLKSQFQLALAKEQAIQAKLEKQKAEKLALDKHVGEYLILEREANINRHLYDVFLKQMQETNLSTEIKTSNMFLAEPALPNYSPVSPKPVRNALFGMVVGMLLGTGLAFFLEYWDRNLKDPRDVERTLGGLVFLGWVPRLNRKFKKWNDRIVQKVPQGAVADSYRQIRTSIWLATVKQRPPSIAITSAGEQEGKTTLAANLAIVMAQIDESRVILVDGDLRRPRVSSVFASCRSAEKEKGLSEYLMGDATIPEILSETDVPNLAIIRSGNIPPNPTELLHSRNMYTLLDWCRAQGMTVIIDTPPMLPVTDAVVIGNLVSGTVLVVCAGQTRKDAARLAVQNLTGRGVKLLGVVMQKVDLKRAAYDYKSYGYRGYASN